MQHVDETLVKVVWDEAGDQGAESHVKDIYGCCTSLAVCMRITNQVSTLEVFQNVCNNILEQEKAIWRLSF